MHLHRSFKPQKCKTQLGLAMSRMKVLRNKKVNALNQMKKEVAQLLKSDQDRHARIRVEHVIREEKIMAAYDLLDVYCELIMTRLQIIEAQKICPIDLKEAISSVIFASPRCADVPELMKICQQFSAKYGKDFVNSALELRPNCGVTPLLVDKLSARAPDIETKVKVLTSIASENDIKWEPKSFEESLQRPSGGFENSLKRSSNFTVDTSKTEVVSQISQKHESVKSTTVDEMMTSAASVSFGTKLQGPTSFERASEIARESTKADFISQRSQKHEVEKAPFINDVENCIKSSESTSSENTNAKVMQAVPKRMASRMEEKGREEQDIGTYSREEVTVAHQEKWGMGFKDAAEAAEVAAESAERASMAARAAAQLAGGANDSMEYCTRDERKPEAPESLHFKSKSSFQEQAPSNETGEMHRKNSANDDQCKGAKNDRSGKTYFSEGTGKDIPSSINSSSMRFNIYDETAKNNQDKEEIRMRDDVHEESEVERRYAFHSYDGELSEEVTEKAHGVEDKLESDRRQSSFDGDTGPTFDGDNFYNGDYIDFDNFGNKEESPSFRNQGYRSSDFPSYVKPHLVQEKSDTISNDNSSLQAHSMKKSYIDESTDNNRKYSLSSPSLGDLTPSYDSDPEERKEVDCIDFLSHQSENDSINSKNLDYSNYESEQVSKIEKLPGGLNRGFLRPPYTVSSEKPLASRENSTMASSRIKNADHSSSYFEIREKHYDRELNRKHVLQKASMTSSSDSDSSEENFQTNDSPTTLEKRMFDPSTRKTSQESLYQRAQKQTSEESLGATVLNSGLKTRTRKVNASLLLRKTSDDISPATEAAVRYEMDPNSGSSTKREVLGEESRVRESDSRQSIHYSGPSNGDGEDSHSYQSCARSGTENVNKLSRRTRGPFKSANVNFPSKSPERAELPVIRRKSQGDVLDNSGNSKFPPHKSQGGITSDSSQGVLSFGTKPRTKPFSVFQPLTWKKDMSDMDSESSSQDSDEDSVSFQMNLAQTSHRGRTQRTKVSASSSSQYSRQSQEDILDKLGNSRFPPRKSQGGITSDSSEGALSFGTIRPRKPNPVSVFQPPTSWEKKMPDENSESSSQITNEDSESFQMNLVQASHRGRTQGTNSTASSSLYSRKSTLPTSSPSDSPKPSNLEKETPKSTASTSRGELERNLSIENKDKAKHVHPKLPDSDKLLAHFQALRSNVRK